MSTVSKKRINEFMSSATSPIGGSTEQPMMIENPRIIMFGQDDKLVCHIHPHEKDSYKSYGLMICDLVRHVANAFKVEEDDVWEWVDKERHHHTTGITRPS